MTKKEKFQIEYPLKGSASMIWSYIGTEHGLSTWFADDIKIDGKTFHFFWGKEEERTAVLIAQRNGVYVRLRWEDENPHTYFEMRITYNEITREHSLEISDFAEPGEMDDQKDLWDSQIEYLKRQSGM
ncbi:MAG: hypothetical protein IKD40_06530 [Bacteroidaceae bacterium]|nr:hypothetical protein [Bacteroidaceae bacterium]